MRAPRIAATAAGVTLAGLLGWQGVMLRILGNGGTLTIQNKVVNDIANANLTPTTSWIVMLALVAVYAATTWRKDARRRAGHVYHYRDRTPGGGV